jgi:hypothetical protein
MAAKTEGKSEVEIFFDMEQSKIRQKLDELFIELKNCKDDALYKKVEMEMRQYSNKLVLKEEETFSIDSVLESVRNNRKLDKRLGGTVKGGYGVDKRYAGDTNNQRHYAMLQ